MYMQDHISLWSKAMFISRYWLSFDICAGRFSQRIPPTEACDVSHCKSIKWHMLPMELFCKSNVCQFLYCILLYGTVLSTTLLHTFFGGILAWWRPKGLCQTNGVLWIYLAHTLVAFSSLHTKVYSKVYFTNMMWPLSKERLSYCKTKSSAGSSLAMLCMETLGDSTLLTPVVPQFSSSWKLHKGQVEWLPTNQDLQRSHIKEG